MEAKILGDQIVQINKEVVETIGPNVYMIKLPKILNISSTFSVPNSNKCKPQTDWPGGHWS